MLRSKICDRDLERMLERMPQHMRLNERATDSPRASMLQKRSLSRNIAGVCVVLLVLWLALLASIHDSGPVEKDDEPPLLDSGQKSNSIGNPLLTRTSRRGSKSNADLAAPIAPERDDSLGRSQWSNASHLIIVAGHTVFMGTDMKHSSAQDEAQWYLLKYQKGQVFLLRNNTAVIEP
jgi:hypothetical protein